jgi:crotonobetainyl-CoA:carnitine CoA-transferase CaiB-like acyl-CoA transferase
LSSPAVRSCAPPYVGLKVVELAHDPAGEFAGRLLAEMGAEVVKLEPPEGSPTRRVGPFARGDESPEASLTFRYYNSNKRSVVADVGQEAGRDLLDRLLETADIFICTLQPEALRGVGLDLRSLSEAHPRLIIAAVTAFGLTGPWADYRSSDLVALALGGPLNSCGYDDHSLPPIRPSGNQAYHTATSFAHIGVLLALLERQKTGRGQLVDISMHEALAMNVELANPYWFYPRVNVQRQTCRHAQPIPTQPTLFRCGDDRFIYYTLILSDQRAWRSLTEWMAEHGVDAGLAGEEYLDLAYRQERFQDIQTIVECFFLLLTGEQAFHDGQARNLPIGLLNAPEDLLEDPHLKARGFFVPVEETDGTTVMYPGASYAFSAFEAAPRTRAPRLGEHGAADAEAAA